MLERTNYPVGVPCWVDTAQPDPRAAADFYGGLFGWELDDRVPAEAPGNYYIASLGGLDVAAVGSPADGLPSEPTWTMYVAVERADDAASAVAKAGGTILADPADVGEAGRRVVCADPSGATFALWEAGRRTGAQVVNEPGTWNFDELLTDEPRRRPIVLRGRLRMGCGGPGLRRRHVDHVVPARVRPVPAVDRSRPREPPAARRGAGRVRRLHRVAAATRRRRPRRRTPTGP